MKKNKLFLILLLAVMLGLTVQAGFAAISAGLQVTHPSRNAEFHPGDNVTIKITMKPEAAEVANQLQVKIRRGNQIIAETVINNPQINNQVQLQIPANTATGEAQIYTIVTSEKKLKGHIDIVSINISRIQADTRITAPAPNSTFAPGQTVNVSVSVNPQAVQAADRLELFLKNANNQAIARINIDNPQANNQAQIQIPANAQ
ncbi:MAG: hypothetical protein ABIH00_09655, partial [Armatimonadota bacterium]